MKKILFAGLALILSACSTQPEPQVGKQNSVPLDLKSVAEYQAQVSSGNTVPASQRQQKYQPVEQPINVSDSQPKATRSSITPQVILTPMLGYGYYRRW